MGDVHDISGAREKRANDLPVKWADEAMFEAEPQEGYTEDKGVVPKVILLSMNADPLGEIASLAMMYEGKVVRDLSDITDEQRRHYFEEVQKTHLQAPLEAVKLHFIFEGVDRAWTQQLERQRTAVYAEQSLRFAVLDDLVHGTSIPPSLFGTEPFTPGAEFADAQDSKAQRWRFAWDQHMIETQRVYQYLVNDGMPQEDARGLLPLSTATRVHYVTDLRNLVGHAGNRLCTQAQFPWRLVFSGIVQAIRLYNPLSSTEGFLDEYNSLGEDLGNSWQFKEIANSQLFRPVCYQMGRCPFNASFDRHCSIRERVNKHEEMGTPSEMWDEPESVSEDLVIRNEEWLLNPDAARRS